MDRRNYSIVSRWALVTWHGVRRSFWGALFCIMSSQNAWATLPSALNTALAKYKIPAASVSALVIPLDSNTALLSHLSEKPRNPASVMKLLTTYAALDILGPAHTWKTQYYINGSLENGILDGDLVIKGGGDPYLVQEQLWLHLAELRAKGLKKISGNLLIDNSTFDLPMFDRAKFDQQPTRLYNVGANASMVNFNASRFRFQPDDGKIKILLDPPMHNVVVNNQLKAAKGKCRGAQSGWSIDFVEKKGTAYVALTGKYRSRCGTYDLRRSVLKADAYLFGLFTYLWRSLGGEFSGGFAQAEVKEEAKPYYTGSAKTLAEVINGTNKYSNNLLARQLLLAIGQHNFPEGTSVADGVNSVRAWLKDKNISMPNLFLENGAGLSRSISLSAKGLGHLLVHAHHSAYQPEFLSSFSLTSVDGTMRKRLKALKLGGKARLKTGYIKGVRSLAGYVRANSGKDYAVVLLIQDKKVNFSNGNQIQDVLIKWVLEKG